MKKGTIPLVLSPAIQGEIDNKTITRNDVLKQVQHDFVQLRQLKNSLPAAERAKVIFKVIDSFMANLDLPENKEMKDSITCRRGCNFCCYQNVDVTWDEAALLLEVAADTIDWERLNDQLPGHKKIEYRKRACVFLKDGECSVYENRPISCRKYLVANDPEQCNSEKYPDGETKVLYMRAAELLATSMMTLNHTGSMAEMLNKVRAKKEKR